MNIAWAPYRGAEKVELDVARAFVLGANAAGDHWVFAEYPSGVAEMNMIYGFRDWAMEMRTKFAEYGLPYWHVAPRDEKFIVSPVGFRLTANGKVSLSDRITIPIGHAEAENQQGREYSLREIADGTCLRAFRSPG
jgi:hypothetical protein